MAINIEDPQARTMAYELANLTGQSLAEAIKMALRQALDQAKASQTAISPRPLSERLNEIALRCAALPDRDDRSVEDILGYDEHGLPS
ncbi:MAG: type II toxin-antitoxin system VapB family antitoxin [Cyanobacteria bacterium P01_A01_bin.17]